MTTTPTPTLHTFSLSDLRREQSLRNLWLPVVVPTQDFTRFNIGHLKDLYPNIWLYGPRGDIYITQLKIFRDQLDRMWEDPEYTAPFISNMRQAVHDLQGFNDPLYDEVTNIALNEWRPVIPYERVGFEHGTLFDDIRYHDVWQEFDNEPLSANRPSHLSSVIQDFIEYFTHHSLNRDIIAKHGDPARYALFADYCIRWGIPT